MRNEIAIIGARSLGQIAAADLTLRGHDVSLYEEPEYSGLLEPLVRNGGIDLLLTRCYNIGGRPTLNYEKVGFAKVHCITTDIKEAIENAEIIIVGVHAYRHERIAELVAPHLREGQTVVISIGNAGSLVFSKQWKEMGVKKHVLLAETCPSLYNGRFGSEYGLTEGQCATTGQVLVPPEDPRARPKLISAFPAKETDEVMSRLKDLFKMVKGSNVLEVALSSNNIIYHAPACLMNACAIDKSGGFFYLHLHAMDENTWTETPSLNRICNAIRAERSAIFERMGWAEHQHFTHAGPPSKSRTPPAVLLQMGPTSIDKHRFVAEDVRIGLTFLSSLGDMIGVPTPTARAVISLLSMINQVDYLEVGRTVERAGIAGLGVDRLNRYLTQGTA